jgi:hypothetical protein
MERRSGMQEWRWMRRDHTGHQNTVVLQYVERKDQSLEARIWRRHGTTTYVSDDRWLTHLLRIPRRSLQSASTNSPTRYCCFHCGGNSLSDFQRDPLSWRSRRFSTMLSCQPGFERLPSLLGTSGHFMRPACASEGIEMGIGVSSAMCDSGSRSSGWSSAERQCSAMRPSLPRSCVTLK